MFSDKLTGLVRSVSNIFDIFDSFQEGSSTFSQPGQHVTQVMTRREPKSVWISLASSGEMAVCQGGLDQFSYTITPTGFILYADVASDWSQINWCVYF